jgi:TolB-like protein/Tfp pilus assembly protein PilF
MPGDPGILSQLWQELKRRKVTRTITVYAAAAFIILELVDIVAPNLGLPEWTFNLVLILLLIGFVITVILSWIYDIHPEGGIVKTEPSHKIKLKEVTKSSNGWKIASYISFIVIIGLIAVNIFGKREREDVDDSLEKSIAVLPFDNMSADEEHAHLGLAIADEIIMELQKIKAFDRVISRSSTMQYKNRRPTVPEMAEKLGVNYIIEGGIQRQEEQVSVRIQVIRAKNEDHVWGEEYNRAWKDINIIQDDIAKKVAEELRIVLTPGEIEIIEKLPTNNLEAYQQYLLGKSHQWGVTQEEVEKGIHHFDRAIELDPNFALAHLSLAISYQYMARYAWIHPKEIYQKAMESIRKAIDLDNSLGEAHAIHGLLMAILEWDFRGPEAEFQKAIRLSPNSSEVYTAYATYLRFTGRYEENIKIAKKIIELNPRSNALGSAYFWAGKYDESIEEHKRIMGTDGSSYVSNMYLAYAYAMKGARSEAIRYALYVESLMEDVSENPSVAADIGWVYGKAGQRDKAEKMLEMILKAYENGKADPAYLSQIYAGLGDTNLAMEYIQKAYDIRSGYLIYIYCMSNTFFVNMSSDPRFTQILEKIGFEVNQY